MAIRWRKDGRLVCAAMTEPEEHDIYIDDAEHYYLAVEKEIIIADENHKENGLWHIAEPETNWLIDVLEDLRFNEDN